MKISIGICTCRNPEGLRATLEALEHHDTRYPFRVVVLDNDINEAARDVVQHFKDALDISYYVEQIPGIPFARNALITAAKKDSFDYLIMIDDDEQPLPGWLDAMIQTALSSNADIVGGGVVPRFEIAPRPPVQKSDFEKLEPATLAGKIAIDSTANILFSKTFFDTWQEPLFDPRFQYSGGSDSELLRRISARSYLHAFAKEAILVEDIPHSRCQEEWLLKRNYRNGNVLGRVTIFHKGLLKALGHILPQGIILWTRGILRMLFAGKNPRKLYLARKDQARAKGMLIALRGQAFEEYASSNYRNK